MGDTVVEKRRGIFKPTGQEVSFKTVWGGHTFTDDECVELLNGNMITFQNISKGGNSYNVTGCLAEQEYNGHKYWGFQKSDGIPDEWCQHKFTDDEKAALESGISVEASDFVSKKTGRTFTTKVTWEEGDDGKKHITPHFDKK